MRHTTTRNGFYPTQLFFSPKLGADIYRDSTNECYVKCLCGGYVCVGLIIIFIFIMKHDSNNWRNCRRLRFDIQAGYSNSQNEAPKSRLHELLKFTDPSIFFWNNWNVFYVNTFDVYHTSFEFHTIMSLLSLTASIVNSPQISIVTAAVYFSV